MEKRGMRKVRTGNVVSTKMDKSMVVNVKSTLRHPVYERVISRSSKYKVHEEKNECNIGDIVEIMETRPLSKTKRWRLKEIVEKAK